MYRAVATWGEQPFVFPDGLLALQTWRAGLLLTTPAGPAPAESKGEGPLPSSLPQVAATMKTNRLSWWNLPCLGVFIPVLLFGVSLFTFLLRTMVLGAFGLAPFQARGLDAPP